MTLLGLGIRVLGLFLPKPLGAADDGQCGPARRDQQGAGHRRAGEHAARLGEAPALHVPQLHPRPQGTRSPVLPCYLSSAPATCRAIEWFWSLQEKPGGDYEISSDSLWELRGESLVRTALLHCSCTEWVKVELAKGVCSKLWCGTMV